MDDIQREHNRQIHEANKKERPEPPPGSSDNFTKWMKGTTYGLAMRRKGAWSEVKRQEYMIKLAKEVGIPSNDINDLKIQLAKYKRENPSNEESPI